VLKILFESVAMSGNATLAGLGHFSGGDGVWEITDAILNAGVVDGESIRVDVDFGVIVDNCAVLLGVTLSEEVAMGSTVDKIGCVVLSVSVVQADKIQNAR
jgi:hypothetical protein